MTQICLLVALAMLCACGTHHPIPMAGADTAPPLAHANPAPLPAKEDVPHVPPPLADLPPRVVSPEPLPGAPRPSLKEAVSITNAQLEDALYAYDQFDLSAEAMAALRHDAALLRTILLEFPTLQISVEGHCDERGSAEYNLGLGHRRATRAADFLYQLGLPRANFVPVSYGKEEPQCTDSTESCWSRNRRAHLVVRTPYESRTFLQ